MKLHALVIAGLALLCGAANAAQQAPALDRLSSFTCNVDGRVTPIQRVCSLPKGTGHYVVKVTVTATSAAAWNHQLRVSIEQPGLAIEGPTRPCGYTDRALDSGPDEIWVQCDVAQAGPVNGGLAALTVLVEYKNANATMTKDAEVLIISQPSRIVSVENPTTN